MHMKISVMSDDVKECTNYQISDCLKSLIVGPKRYGTFKFLMKMSLKIYSFWVYHVTSEYAVNFSVFNEDFDKLTITFLFSFIYLTKKAY